MQANPTIERDVRKLALAVPSAFGSGRLLFPRYAFLLGAPDGR